MQYNSASVLTISIKDSVLFRTLLAALLAVGEGRNARSAFRFSSDTSRKTST